MTNFGKRPNLPEGIPSDQQRIAVEEWFVKLRDLLCSEMELLEEKQNSSNRLPGRFEKKPWNRLGGGGGVMSIMKGKVFEKVGVNVSTVYGDLSSEFAAKLPGTSKNTTFWASGISLVAHPYSPLVPAVHMNTRHIVTGANWFGGGADLTPTISNNADTALFHGALKEACDCHSSEYYERYKAWCDEYFFLPHRDEPRGVGGIFFDYVNTGDWKEDFMFVQDVGRAFLEVYPEIVKHHMEKSWSRQEREQQLIKRGRYVEFYLLHERGTQFGLQTGGYIEAILMSMPPSAKWQ